MDYSPSDCVFTLATIQSTLGSVFIVISVLFFGEFKNLLIDMQNKPDRITPQRINTFIFARKYRLALRAAIASVIISISTPQIALFLFYYKETEPPWTIGFLIGSTFLSIILIALTLGLFFKDKLPSVEDICKTSREETTQ